MKDTLAADVRTLRAMADRDYILETLADLIRIPSVSSPSGDGEALAAAYLTKRMAELGMESRCDEVSPGRANATGRLPGPPGGPVVILNGHLDVVPPGEGWTGDPFGPAVRDGRMYGRGAADMKGAIAAMLGAAKLIRDHCLPVEATLLLAFVCDEEMTNTGVSHFLGAHPAADFAVIGEPTGMRVAAAHRGDFRYRLTAYGRSGHIGRPEGTVNAIYQIKKAIGAILERNAELKKRTHPLLPSPMIGATVIRGGVKDNVVPAECALTVDRRLLPGETRESALAELRDMMGAIEAEDPEFRWSAEELLYLGPGEADTSNGQTDRLLEIWRDYYGEPSALTGFGATCEQVCFLREGINAVICGPGDVAQAHTAGEWIDLEEVFGAAGFYAACAVNGGKLSIHHIGT